MFVSICIIFVADGERDFSIVVDMVSQIHHVLLMFDKELSSEDRKSLAQHLLQLGFREDALKISPGLKVNAQAMLRVWTMEMLLADLLQVIFGVVYICVSML